jgi:hypothetical protein
MREYKLDRISYQLWSTTVVAPNGTQYTCQIWYTGPKYGYSATIQRQGAPENRPLDEHGIPDIHTSIEALNAVLARIGAKVELRG